MSHRKKTCDAIRPCAARIQHADFKRKRVKIYVTFGKLEFQSTTGSSTYVLSVATLNIHSNVIGARCQFGLEFLFDKFEGVI